MLRWNNGWASFCHPNGCPQPSNVIQLRMHLDVPQAQPAPASAFYRRGLAPTSFTMPPSEEYLGELHACWRDSRALSLATSDGQTLAAMQDAPKFGLDRMSAVEKTIAALIVSPEEALRPDARCPHPKCRVTDQLLSKAYDAAALMGRRSNSMSHLMLALSASLQEARAVSYAARRSPRAFRGRRTRR